jgi:hypothetical protein
MCNEFLAYLNMKQASLRKEKLADGLSVSLKKKKDIVICVSRYSGAFTIFVQYLTGLSSTGVVDFLHSLSLFL